jgi:hypothetical protein
LKNCLNNVGNYPKRILVDINSEPETEAELLQKGKSKNDQLNDGCNFFSMLEIK